MTRLELKNDAKLNSILSEENSITLTQRIAKGYLKGRAITLFFDLLSQADSKISFELINGRIFCVSGNAGKKYKYVHKHSVIPFWARNIFHQVGLCLNGYKEKHMAKAEKIAAALISGVEIFEATSDLKHYQEASFCFTKKAYKPKTQPKSFNEELITVQELQLFLIQDKFRKILEDGTLGTHGNPAKNIIMAFNEGTFNATLKGRQPLIDNPFLNKELIRKMRVVMTLILKKDPNEQMRLLRRLVDPFKACGAGRVLIIQQLYDELLSVNLGFEGEIENKLHAFKYSIFEQLLHKKHRPTEFSPIHLQLPHLTMGYLAAVGKRLGMEGVEAAAADRHRYKVPFNEHQSFIQQFKQTFQASLDEFCMGIISEINCKNGTGIDPHNYAKWVAERVLNNDLPKDFGYYLEDKKAFYSTLNPPDDDQEGCLTNYVSPAEVKQILSILNLIKET